ncbi:unnamed protein product [Danaus chrysippus]|uniref:(African queen) hypothetical protein n=1 Tax=Danaus chrysippus TaxID=151541 RepID=A0A8J2R404_9NEOP|nr:unnamed protein product [Danaus chrysippus]
MAVEKLYESDDFLIVNKPYDMYINSDDENEKNTLVCQIASHDSHLSTSANPLRFVQRLDFATSGVICIAKSKTAAAQAGKLFEKRLTKKYYVAIVRKHLKFELADIRYPIGVDLSPENSHKMATQTADTTCGSPREALTRILLLETGFYGSDPASVVLLKPITGRRHQLRVHCLSIGHTLLGDYTYSAPVDTVPHRMFLHATRLVLPLQKQPLDIQTLVPFFSDPQFTCKWKTCKVYYKYRTKEDFAAACDVIDKSYTVGIKYEEYSTNKRL